MFSDKSTTDYTNDLENSIVVIRRSILLFVIALASVYFVPRLLSDVPLTFDATVWGAVGDFFGGLLNPFFSILTIYLLVKSLRLQNKELSDATSQLKETRLIHANSLMYEDTKRVFEFRAEKLLGIPAKHRLKASTSNGGLPHFVELESPIEEIKATLAEKDGHLKLLYALQKFDRELVDMSLAGLDLLKMEVNSYILRQTLESVNGLIMVVEDRAKQTGNTHTIEQGLKFYSELITKSKVTFLL